MIKLYHIVIIVFSMISDAAPLPAAENATYDKRGPLPKDENWAHWMQTIQVAKPYDLIEINRYKGVYQHWVMYIGNGTIVHVTQVTNRTEGEKAEMRRDLLSVIAKEDPCRVNNHEDRGLTVKSEEEINRKIQDVLKGQVIIVPYFVLQENCEYYVTLWKFGVGFSAQIENAKKNGIPPEKLYASVELAATLEYKDVQNYFG